MASSEKQMIPLEDIPHSNEGLSSIQQSSTEDLLDVKLPSRSLRRRVVVIAVALAVLIVIAVAACLIGKYVPEYLSKANSKCK